MPGLILYGSNVAAASVSTASKLAITTGGVETTVTTTPPVRPAFHDRDDRDYDYTECFSQGGTSAFWRYLPGIPTDFGWILDTTLLEGATILSGVWTASIAIANTTHGPFFFDISMRFHKRSSTGLHTFLGKIKTSDQQVGTTRTVITLTSAILPSMAFATGDKLYVDLFVNPEGGNYELGYWRRFYDNDDFVLYVSNSGTAGVANDLQITTPGYVTTAQQPQKTMGTRARIRVGNSASFGTRANVIGPRIPSGGIALFASGTGIASFDSLRVTQYPDPAVSLASVTPRLGSSSVTWHATTPTNTTLGMDVSLDGGLTWTDVTNSNGGAIPGLFAQPLPTIDGFTTNTSANYTNTNRTGGATATAMYDLANSRLALTSGTNGIYTYSAISRADIDMFADMDRSDAGGLVWRFVDANNFYVLVIGDHLASVGTPSTATLYSIKANVQTQLAQVAITFVRGTYHRFRVKMLLGVITVLMDGSVLFTYTDGSPLAAGMMGLFNNGGATGSRYYQLWLSPQGDVVTGTPSGDKSTGTFVYTRQRMSTSDPAQIPQLLDLTVAATNPSISQGATIPSGKFQNTFLAKNMDDLAKQSNYMWWMDQTNALYFGPGSPNPAPWILQSSSLVPAVDLEDDTNLIVEKAANPLYRNRQTVLGVLNTASFVNTFIGDGKATSFTLSYPVATGLAPTITLDNVVQTVGLKGTVGSQWYYAVGDAVIAQDTAGVLLQATDSLTVTYTGTYVTQVTVDNTAAQAALAAVEGSTGIVEAVDDVTGQGMNLTAGTDYANNLLTRYCIQGRSITFRTYRDGLAVGQTISVFIPEENLIDAQMQIYQIDMTMRTQPNMTILWEYVVQASELPNPGSWSKLVSSALLVQSVTPPGVGPPPA